MSDSEAAPNPPQAMAFEYVSGTLRGAERLEFERLLESDETLRHWVHYWEEQLFELHTNTPRVEAPDGLWDRIERQAFGVETAEPIQPTAPARDGLSTRIRKIWQAWQADWMQWALPSAVTAMLCLALIPWLVSSPAHDEWGYVAVMTQNDGEAILTATTDGEGEALSLHFSQEITLDRNEDLQIWALSKSDGQIRSLAVVDDDANLQLALDTAQWRLIKDAHYLILTREESGGSAIDEPSHELIARGYCVQLTSESA